MKEEILTINNKKYKFTVWQHFFHKRKYDNNSFGMTLAVEVYSVEEERYLKFSEMSEYMKEKLTDYIANSANGERTFYK